MLSFSHVFEASVEQVWSVVGTVDRVDWVPGVAACNFQAGVRTLNLPGAGESQERIVECNAEKYFLRYQCIESPIPLEFHEARMQLTELSAGQCRLTWEAEIKPVSFESFLKESMSGALAQLISVVETEPSK